jgi:hypothetical protein
MHEQKSDSAAFLTVNSIFRFSYFGPDYPTSKLSLSGLAEVDSDDIHQKCNNHHTRLETHENPLLKKKLIFREENRRLKRNWPTDLI